mmetsp:Transcript_15327/g.41970  ORF Transcript_15327/g.41970 Transcript_15327/m.41970 type:complete len:332 (+) Transcript_15327:833-1828(+)
MNKVRTVIGSEPKYTLMESTWPSVTGALEMYSDTALRNKIEKVNITKNRTSTAHMSIVVQFEIATIKTRSLRISEVYRINRSSRKERTTLKTEDTQRKPGKRNNSGIVSNTNVRSKVFHFHSGPAKKWHSNAITLNESSAIKATLNTRSTITIQLDVLMSAYCPGVPLSNESRELLTEMSLMNPIHREFTTMSSATQNFQRLCSINLCACRVHTLHRRLLTFCEIELKRFVRCSEILLAEFLSSFKLSKATLRRAALSSLTNSVYFLKLCSFSDASSWPRYFLSLRAMSPFVSVSAGVSVRVNSEVMHLRGSSPSVCGSLPWAPTTELRGA